MPDYAAVVHRWLNDVSCFARDRSAALAVLKSELHSIQESERMPSSFQSVTEPVSNRLVEAIVKLEDNADKVTEFVMLMNQLPNTVLASALVLKVVNGKTWHQCAKHLRVSRQHLERLYKQSMPDLLKLTPKRYRSMSLVIGSEDDIK